MSVALVVDDHADGTFLLRCLLEAEGFEVVQASNGREALQAVERKSVDIIVSDILMPVMDGFSLCRACKSDDRLRATPFVFYTATYVDQCDEDLAMRLGADRFLLKSTEPETLRRELHEVLARPNHAPATSEASADTPFLKQYNEVLIHKLEAKFEELDTANRALQVKDFALASSASGIVLTLADGRITFANAAMLRMARKSPGDVLDKRVDELFADAASFVRWFADRTREGASEMQLLPASPGASPIWVRVEKHPILGDGGCSLGIMLSCADVTEERALRRELAQAQRLESLSLFAAGVAHDFNNLLMGIFAALELETDQMDARADLAADRQANREAARAAFMRARDLTRRLLTFSTGTIQERCPTDLRQLLDECIQLSLSGSAMQCHRDYCEGPAVAVVDPGQMAQVMSNLLVNARQAMNESGSLAVSVAVEDLVFRKDEGAIRAVKMTVSDRGPGIAPDILDKIFEPYFTTKKHGNGLGLATSHAIVTEHGGQIAVSSRPGEGTTFTVCVPAADQDSLPARQADRESVELRHGRILVMDDDLAIQSLLKQGLEKTGYSVVVAGNGEQALLEFARARSEGRPFDLLVLDITVKGGMGGLETIRRLRKIDPQVLALATTGYAYGGTSGELQAHGFARMLAKPFLLHELRAVIKALLP